MSRSRELIKNTLILAIGKLSAQAISFLLIPVYTIFLSTGEFGAVDIAITYITLSALLFSLQIERGVFRHLIDARGNKSKITTILSNSLVSVLPALTILIILATIVGHSLSISYISLIIVAASLLIFATIVLQTARGVGDNKLFATANILGSVVLFAVIFIAIGRLGLGVEGALAGYIASSLVILLYTSFRLKLWEYISVSSIDKSTIRELLAYSWPLIPSAASWWVIRSADRTIITIFIGLSAAGLYAAAAKYVLIFMALYSIFDMAWTESASKYINNSRKNAFFSEVYNSAARIFILLATLMVAATPFVFNIFIGEEFRLSYEYIPLLLLTALANVAVSMLSVIYIAKKLTKKVLATSLLAAAISVLLGVSLIEYLGVYSVIVGSLVAFTLMATYRYFDVRKYVAIKINFTRLAGLLVLYAIVTAVYYSNSTWLQIATFVGVAILVAIISRADITRIYNLIVLRKKNRNLSA